VVSFVPKLPPVQQFVSAGGVRVYRIACRVFTHLSARVYLVLGAGPPTLFDTGSGRGESTRQILDGLESVGRDFGESFRPAHLERIILTHAHLDHVGGLAELVERTGARVAAHPLECRAVSACDEHAAEYNRRLEAFFRHAGVEPALRETLLAADRESSVGLRGVPVSVQLEDAARLDGLAFVHTPGHSPGHLCAIADDLLLSGDHVLAQTVPQPWPETLAPKVSLAHYFDSLEEVRRIDGLRCALPAHESVVDDIADRIDAIRRSHVRRLDRVAEIIRRAGQPLTIREIADRMYARPQGVRVTLALCDVGARVEHLSGQGVLAVANEAAAQRLNEPCIYELAATPPRRPAVLLIGPTGSGKTPLGELIESRGLWGAECVHFDFGANLREIVHRNTPDDAISRRDIDFLREVLESGALLEDKDFPIASGVLRSFMARRAPRAATWIVLNGLPRHAGQAEAIRGILDVRAVVHLRCSSEDVVRRIADDVGGDRSARDDDDLDAVRRKLAIFEERTAPLLDYYAGRGARIETLDVTAEMTPSIVWEVLSGR